MTLSENEYKEYLTVHLSLLYFAGLYSEIVPSTIHYEQFLDIEFKTKFKCRDALLKDQAILDEYIASNYDHLTKDQDRIVEGFRRKIYGEFIILKCLKNYAIFKSLTDNLFYAVNALSDTFDEFFERFPVHVETALIPFKDKIIYDGFFKSSGIYFGKNLARELNEEYKIAKFKKEIVTRL